MVDKARITAFALITILLGLASPHGRALAAKHAQSSLVPNTFEMAAVSQPERAQSRVVSTQEDKSDEKKKKKKTESEGETTGPMEVFGALEKAWNEKDVGDILEHFGKAKVTIAIEGTGPAGGKFSKSQSYYLLKDLFKYTITRKFEFVQYRRSSEESSKKKSNSTFAVAERFYQKTDDGRLFKDKIYVALHMEGDRWVIDEIKSIR